MINPFETLDKRLSNIELILLEIKHSPQNPEKSSDEILTLRDACDFLHLKPPTIYRMVGAREIPFSKRQQKLYFEKRDLEAWIRAGRRKTREELDREANEMIK